MNTDKRDLLLYAVTDRSWLNGRTLAEQTEEALRGGVTCVQLREKNLGYEEFLKEAVRMKELCRRYRVPLLINDCAEIALLAGADGVHVGQGDMGAREVRAVIGKDKILGVTAHTPEQAVCAERDGADYIGAGAAFGTSTKPGAGVIGPAGIKDICRAVKIPVIAIGGINAGNAAELAGCGICGIAAVSAVFAAQNIKKAAAELKKLAEKVCVR